jgi:hypothetical protein
MTILCETGGAQAWDYLNISTWIFLSLANKYYHYRCF